jgi:hypothetical protein
VWLLVWKELRLQQITFVVVGLYLLGWTALAILVWTGARPADDALGMMSPMYGGMLAVLIGALSSAEERHHGTHEWQMLLPMAASRQWLVKVSVMLGLVLLFAVGLPYFLAAIAPSARVWWVPRVWPVFAAGLVLLASVGLYTSSLCTSGVRALVFSLPVLTLGQMALSSLWWLTSRILASALPAPSSARSALPAGREVMYWLTLAVALAAVPLLLHYAYQNHRSSDRDVKRAALQVVRMAGWAAAGMLLLIVVERFAFGG